MAPPEQTLLIPRAALFQDLVGVVEPIAAAPSPTGTVLLESGRRDGSRPLSDRVRTGGERRGRHRGAERRSVRSGSAGDHDIRSEVLQDGVLSWFEDLRWGTPLARKLMGLMAAVAFLAFCVFVLMVTLNGQAVL